MASMQRAVLIGAGIVVVLGVGGYFVASRIADQRVKAALDGQIAKLPAGYSVTYGSVHHDLLSGITSIDHLAIAAPLPGGVVANPTGGAATLSIAADRLEVAGAPTDLDRRLSAISSDPASVTQGTVIPIADRFTITALSVAAPAVSVAIAKYSIADIRLHPWPMTQAGALPSLALLAPLTGDSASPPMDEVLKLLRYEAAALLAIETGTTEMTGMTETVATPATAQAPAMSILVVLSHASGGGLHDGHTGATILENLEEKVGALADIKIAALTMKPIDFAQPARHLLAGDPLLPALANGLRFEGIDLRDMSVSTPVAGDITLGDFSIGNIAVDQGLVVSAHLGLDKLVLKSGQIPQIEEAFKRLGLTTLTSSFATDYALAPGPGAGSVTAMLKIDELGTLNMTTNAQLPARTPDAAPPPVMTHALLTYVDASLVDRLLKAGAAASGVDQETFRNQLIALVHQRGQIVGKDSPATIALFEAAAQFLKAPKSFKIEASPPQPVSADAIESDGALPPPAMVAKYGIVATAN